MSDGIRDNREPAECTFCNEPVTPRNRLADRHVCRTCMEDTQLGERVDP